MNPCTPNNDNSDTISITISVRRADVARLFTLGAAAERDEVYITAGPQQRLPAGYHATTDKKTKRVGCRVLEDAARSGELVATKVPKAGYRITAADLAAWETKRSERRRRRPTVPLAVVDDDRSTNQALLAQAGVPRRASR